MEVVAVSKHNELLNTHPNYSSSNVDIQDFIAQYGADAYLASASIYEAYMEEVGEFPDDPCQWQLMLEVFLDDLAPLLIEFTPGIGDLIGSYNEFSEGNIFWGCVNLVGVIFPNEAFKAFKEAPTIRKGCKSMHKVFILWNKLFTTVGGQKVLNKLPQSWKDLPGSKLADNGKGLSWRVDAQNEFRMMEETSSHIINKQEPYARLNKGGKFLGINNKYLYKQNGKFFEIIK